MKLLKLKVLSDYKMLKKGFEINFLTKTRVNKNSDNDDLIELEPGFYYPVETAFVGKNSSGKTTTLSFIRTVMYFLRSGRISSDFLIEQFKFSFECLFYYDKTIYKYYGEFEKNELVNRDYLIIKDEMLQKAIYRKNYTKDLSNANFKKDEQFVPNINGDTSSISKKRLIDFSISIDTLEGDETSLFIIGNRIDEIYGKEVFKTLINMFDDSIEYIKKTKGNNDNAECIFKRINKPEKYVDFSYLRNHLSAGTYRGLYLFAASILAFNYGGTILIDEIERSFNKNLIENLFMLFRDKRINKKGASIIYSTHYAELLDTSDRCDNINVLHRNGDSITVNNMHSSYKVRTDLSKSSQFEQNAFDNHINYEKLMDLRRNLIK
ncbi:MAG TPA: ATP-binding protein [Erysipelotrichaceae bacterium]|nr:ATP-binding protein [Erysipelotrichaceae bacterium]